MTSRRSANGRKACAGTTCLALACAMAVSAVAPVPAMASNRPYEFVWANRTQDEYPPLLDFEAPVEWQIGGSNSVAKIEQSNEQQLWGDFTEKLTYRATGPSPTVRALLQSPIALPVDFDSIGLWVYGRSMFYGPEPGTPPTTITVLLASPEGAQARLTLGTVNFAGWSYMFCKVPPEQRRSLAGGKLLGIEVADGTNSDDRTLFFDNLGIFKEKLGPLTFEPRPLRNLVPFPGQTTGLNNGPGKLPFPTREETILPPNLVADFHVTAVAKGNAYIFRYKGMDGSLTYILNPRLGPFDGLTAQWDGRGAPFRPCVGGGLRLAVAANAGVPDSTTFLGGALSNGVLTTKWRFVAGAVSQLATLNYRIWNKSLVIDILAPGGNVAEVRYGHAEGLETPRLVTSPYYAYNVYANVRPAVILSGPPDKPIFVAGATDWYRSNASELFAANSVDSHGVVYNGGTRYGLCTNGRRNDCFERLFITVSPRYDEVLPTIPNPKSPYLNVGGTRLWHSFSASPDKMQDREIFKRTHSYGLTQMIVTNHETLWRDGNESFTFRTQTAPAKGGDEAEKAFSRFMQDDLGYVYGPYNNFTDLAPVNANWSLDNVSRHQDYSLVSAWARCYNPKPSRAVEYAARLTPIIQAKFHYSTAYCDVHTAVPPWQYTDYDSRVPGAGTFASTFYAYGEIMLIQKQSWRGPVYSEGGQHWMYAGLTDGNYAQDQGWKWEREPWLVDFDLRRIHDQEADFGMGNLDMFRHGEAIPANVPDNSDTALDRFTAATLAFGHAGFWAFSEPNLMMRNYYMVQQIASRYTQVPAKQILYVGGDGTACPTSDALANGAYKRSQVAVQYADGTVVVANGNWAERLRAALFGRRVDLPPNGYAAWTADGKINVLSSDPDGLRCDYAVAPAYIFVDGRGHWARFPLAASNGAAVARNLGNGNWEIIADGNTEAGFAIGGTSATAQDDTGKELGPAALRIARGLTYVQPVPGAFSYRVAGGNLGATAPRQSPLAGQAPLPAVRVLAGQSIKWNGSVYDVPDDTLAGTRLWHQFASEWLDFAVAPVARLSATLSPDDSTIWLDISGASGPATLRMGSVTRKLNIDAGAATREAFAVDSAGASPAAGTRTLTFDLAVGGKTVSLNANLTTVIGVRSLVDFQGLSWQPGIVLRPGSPDVEMDETGANATEGSGVCGGVARPGIIMHPPFNRAVGYTYALFEPVKLPLAPAVFRALVGKRDGSDLGDGILYRFVVVDSSGRETELASLTVKEHEWLPLEADLSAYAGQTVQFKLIADPGPQDNTSGDWADWADLRVESANPLPVRTLDAKP